MDTELFELCMEVYERFPDWPEHTKELMWLIKGEHGDVSQIYSPSVHWPTTPLYTSDYLLEKLPPVYKDGFLTVGESVGKWGAWYQHGITKRTIMSELASTPLKALLKLTIALHDAGELK